MIEMKNVVKEYGDFRLQVDFSVPREGITVLLGSSGSGKTTTLRMIGGFEVPDRGSIVLDNQDITRVPVQHRNIGFVFQDYALFPHLTVGENVAYGLKARGLSRARRVNKVAQLLELTGLAGFDHRKITTLSGGEQQRVALARALAPDPRALLLDEPFSAVDPERREDLGSYLLDLQRKISIPMVFVTHSRQEAMSLASTIILLKNGRVVETGPPSSLYERPCRAFTARFLGRANILTAGQWGGVRVELIREPETGIGEDQLYMIRPDSLEVRQCTASESFGLNITGRTYLGGRWEYQVESGEQVLYARSPEMFQIGQSVVLECRNREIIPVE